MTPEEHKRLSKKMSSLLRHRPRDLLLDSEGFTPLSEFTRAVNATEAQVREIVRDSDKQRFELLESDKQTFIRARYGHSAVPEVSYQTAIPPEILYHGTSRIALDAIRREGLRSMNRQYVHLSIDTETALRVGKRHDPQPILLTIRAGEAHRAGVEFSNPETRLFLVEALDPQWIDFP